GSWRCSPRLRCSLPPPATPEVYPLSLRDALPICRIVLPGTRSDLAQPHRQPPEARERHGPVERSAGPRLGARRRLHRPLPHRREDRKSTRLNSSHVKISYAVFCLKKKKAVEDHAD